MYVFVSPIPWMRNEISWRDVRVTLGVHNESSGYDPSHSSSMQQKAESSGDLACRKWPFLDRNGVLNILSKPVRCMHNSVGRSAAGEKFWFLSASSKSFLVFCVQQKNSKSRLSSWTLFSFLASRLLSIELKQITFKTYPDCIFLVFPESPDTYCPLVESEPN